eukprot:3063809-Amphidinium_carterae.1
MATYIQMRRTWNQVNCGFLCSVASPPMRFGDVDCNLKLYLVWLTMCVGRDSDFSRSPGVLTWQVQECKTTRSTCSMFMYSLFASVQTNEGSD